MSGGGTPKETTLELVWQQDATAILFVRDADGALSAGDLELGKPAVATLALAGGGFPARRLDVHELIRVADAPPAEPAPSAGARGRSSPSSSWRTAPSPKGSSTRTSTTPAAGGTRSGERRSTRASRRL